MHSAISVFALIVGLVSSSAYGAPAPAFVPPMGKVSIASPKDGAVVTSPVKVLMVSTVKLRPAGEDPNDHKTGHHHLIIDGTPITAGQVIPTDATHLHFGKAQTEATIPLTPGHHTLTLQLADGAHRSYGPDLSNMVHITVK